jgi:hypothetical protein
LDDGLVNNGQHLFWHGLGGSWKGVRGLLRARRLCVFLQQICPLGADVRHMLNLCHSAISEALERSPQAP